MLWLGQFRSSWWHFSCRVLTYFDHLMWRTDSLEKTLILRKIEGNRRRGWSRMRQLDSITDSIDVNLSELQKTVKDRGEWHAADHGVAKCQTRLSDWTTTSSLAQNFFTCPGEESNNILSSFWEKGPLNCISLGPHKSGMCPWLW